MHGSLEERWDECIGIPHFEGVGWPANLLVGRTGSELQTDSLNRSTGLPKSLSWDSGLFFFSVNATMRNSNRDSFVQDFF